MVFSQNLLYACTMKTIPAIETNRPTKKYRERKQECSLPRAKSPMRCAGINRHEAGNERVLRERSSEPLGPEFCVAHREVFGEA